MSTENEIIALSAGSMQIDVWTIGARLNAVSWNGIDGMVDGAETPEDAIGPKLNHGCVVGPVANRIAGSEFEIDGTTHSFEPNEGTETFLHSGAKSLRDFVWTVASRADTSARLIAEVADMADGFPGNRQFTAEYSVLEDGFDLTFAATTDAPTFVNIALHPFWSLDLPGRDGLKLGIRADSYTPVDQAKIPTGEIAPVDETQFDLRTPAIPSTSIDHNYCLDGDITQPAATVISDAARMDIYTDAPGLQVFTGRDFGIALEPQHWPDAPHHDNFPTIRLDPGQTYTQTSRYRFTAL